MSSRFNKIKSLIKTLLGAIRQYQEYRTKNKTPYL